MKKEMMKINLGEFLQRVKELPREDLVQRIGTLGVQIHECIANEIEISSLFEPGEYQRNRYRLYQVVRRSLEHVSDLTDEQKRTIHSLAFILRTDDNDVFDLSDFEIIEYVEQQCHANLIHVFNTDSQYILLKLYIDVVDYILKSSQGRHVEWLVKNRRILENNVHDIHKRWSMVPELKQRIECFLRLLEKQDNNTVSAKISNIISRIWSTITVYDVLQLSIIALLSAGLFNMITLSLSATIIMNAVSFSLLVLPFNGVACYFYSIYNRSFNLDSALLMSIRKQSEVASIHLRARSHFVIELQKKDATCRKLNRTLIDALQSEYHDLQKKNNITQSEQNRMHKLEQDIQSYKTYHGSFFARHDEKKYIEDPKEKLSELWKMLEELGTFDPEQMTDLRASISGDGNQGPDPEMACHILQNILTVESSVIKL